MSSLSSKIAVNSAAQAARQIVVAVAGIVSVGVATRYLSIDEYGGVLAALVLLSLVSVASDFGISAMTVRAIAREPEKEVAIASSAFWVWIAFSIPTALVILLISHLAYPGPENEVTRQAVLVLMSTFVLAPLGGVANVMAIARQRVWITSVASILARALALGAIIAAALLDLGTLGISVAFASGFVLESFFAIVLVRPRVEPRLGLDAARIRTLIAAAVPLGLVMVVNSMYFRIDAFLLSVLGSDRDVALYGVAYRAFDTLLALPGFVMITLLPVLARLSPDEPRFQELVQKAFTGMAVLALPIAGFSLLGPEAMVALAGSQYREGGPVLTLIMLSVACACVQGVFGNTLVTQGKQLVLLRVSLAVLVVNVALNAAAIPLLGAPGAAGALLVSELLSLSLTMVAYRTVAPLPRIERPARMLLALAALVAAGSVRFAIPDDIVAMLVAVVVGSAAYVAALFALNAMPEYIVRPLLSAARTIRPRSVT